MMQLALFVAGRIALLAVWLVGSTLSAQQWNGERATELATRATDVRARQIADSMLTDYSADARGKLIFQVKLGDGFLSPPVTVKATEIAVRLFWMQPGRSKQVIVGMRDTMLLPGNIGYYQDRYGIVQNNFPDVIRLGDGRDVRDVVHPLSALGLRLYDFALSDSLRFVLPNQTVDVYSVNVRPRDPTSAAVTGRIYIERESAAVVRMSFAFTQAAFLDKRNESLSIVIENALVNQRFWLPSRQELHLTRRDAVLDFPANSIIRASWRVCCYDVNVDVPAANFVGPEIVRSSPGVMNAFTWEEDILDVLPPDVRILTPEQIKSLRQDAEALIQARAFARARGGSLSVRRISDFARVNRVEGLALGGGAKIRSGTGLSLGITGRYGISDKELKGAARLDLTRPGSSSWQLYAERDYADASVIGERSMAVNSIATPLFGSDFTSLFESRGAGLRADLAPLANFRPRAELSYQWHAPLTVNLKPLGGTFVGTVAADNIHALSAAVHVSGTSATGLVGSSIQWDLSSELAAFAPHGQSVSLSGNKYFRLYGSLNARRPLGEGALVMSLFAGTSGSDAEMPAQKLFYFGGPASAPGYGFHELAGESGASTRLEVQLPVPFPSIGLGRYGKSPAKAIIAPWISAAAITSPRPGLSRAPAEPGSPNPAAPPITRSAGVYPSVGIGAEFLYDLLRVDVARGLRDGRWNFSVDIMKSLWGIL